MAKVEMLITSKLKDDFLMKNIHRSRVNINFDSFPIEEGVEIIRRRTDHSLEELNALGWG